MDICWLDWNARRRSGGGAQFALPVGFAGIAGGVWSDAAEFIGTRQFTRFTPVMPRESAAELMGGWQRAVRAALIWARDPGEAEGAKKKKKHARSPAGKGGKKAESVKSKGNGKARTKKKRISGRR